jgi:hypothetical protein
LRSELEDLSAEYHFKHEKPKSEDILLLREYKILLAFSLFVIADENLRSYIGKSVSGRVI